MNIKYIFLIGMLLVRTISFAQNKIENERITFKDIDEIIQLYNAELHTVIISKLQNIGFNLVNEVPDYKLNKMSYSGQYSLVKEISIYPEIGFKLTSGYHFKTIKYSNSATEYLIEFEIYSNDSRQIFANLQNLWLVSYKSELFEMECNYADCFRVGSVEDVFCVTEEGYTPKFELSPFGSFLVWESSFSPKPKDSEERKVYRIGENEEVKLLDIYLGGENNYIGGRYYFRKLNQKIYNLDEWIESQP